MIGTLICILIMEVLRLIAMAFMLSEGVFKGFSRTKFVLLCFVPVFVWFVVFCYMVVVSVISSFDVGIRTLVSQVRFEWKHGLK